MRRFLCRPLTLICLVVILAFAAPTRSSKPPLSYKFKNGLWFDGQKFSPKSFYSVKGILREKWVGEPDKTVDLAGKFIIPPLAEGHNHWLEMRAVDAYVQNYLRDGVFYVKDHSNSPAIVSQVQDKLNLPNSVDFVTSLQGFTAPGGHPLEVLEQCRRAELLPPEIKEKDMVTVVDSARAIAECWPLFMKGKPAFVKIFLIKSEEFPKRKDDSKYLYKRGLDPSLVQEIVRRAHAARLRVSAHVETAGDFHNALVGGVDDIAHLPGIGFDPLLGKHRFLISEADARLAAERRVTVLTTLRWLEKDYSENKALAEQLKMEVIVPNLRLLKKHHVKILVGSDQFRETPLPEILFLAKLGVFTNLEILEMACEDTPRAMFADRRIGFLRDGYEASFLALDRDPLADLNHLKTIHWRFKQGLPLHIPGSK